MRKILILTILILSFCNFSYTQYYTKAQIINIDNNKLAFEGDMYLDTINNDYFIGLTNGGVGSISEKVDSIKFLNDTNLIFYWNFNEKDTVNISSILDSSEWKYDDEYGVYLRRAVIENAATDDSVVFATHGRLIIADSIKQSLVYQNPNTSTQIFLANYNPLRDMPRQISIANYNTAGNRAYSLFTTTTDSSRMFMGSHGSSRTLTRMGLPVRNSSEIVAVEGDLHIGTREANSIYFGTDNLSRGIWDKDGNVGIGTVEPFVPWITGAGALAKLPAKLAVKTETGRQDNSFFSSASTSNPVNVFLSAPLSTGDTGSFALSFRGNHVTPLYTDWVDFLTNDGTGIVRERMLRFNMLNGDVVFDGGGRLGVQTNTPTDTLDVNGTLRVRELPKGATTDSILTVNDSGQMQKRSLDSVARDIKIANVINVTGNYTVSDSELGSVYTINSATPVTFTIPAGLPIGYNISVYQTGAGQVTIEGATGVTLKNRLSTFKLAGMDSAAGIIATSTDVFHVSGDLKK